MKLTPGIIFFTQKFTVFVVSIGIGDIHVRFHFQEDVKLTRHILKYWIEGSRKLSGCVTIGTFTAIVNVKVQEDLVKCGLFICHFEYVRLKIQCPALNRITLG